MKKLKEMSIRGSEGRENLKKSKKPKRPLGFPGGAVIENLPANAGDVGSNPGLGRSHMPQSSWTRAPQLLSLHSRAREPQLLGPRATTMETRVPGACDPQQEIPPQ